MDLFVAGITLDIDEKTLIKIFDMYGFTVKTAKIIKDKSTGFSRGFGFVTIEDRKEAERAISKLNGQFFESSRMTVKEAKPHPQKRDAYTPPRKSKEKASYEGEI